jgi:hypothetical protein
VDLKTETKKTNNNKKKIKIKKKKKKKKEAVSYLLLSRESLRRSGHCGKCAVALLCSITLEDTKITDIIYKHVDIKDALTIVWTPVTCSSHPKLFGCSNREE